MRELLLLLAVMVSLTSIGQVRSRSAAEQPGTSTTRVKETEKREKPVEPRTHAWRADEPLGLRHAAEVDTVFEDFHYSRVATSPSIAWATTGNYGAPGVEMVFMRRAAMSDFVFEDAIRPWLHSSWQQRYYNSRVPITIASYSTGGNKQSNQDRTSVIFSGNASSKLQLGAMMDYIYSKGSYNYQSDKDFSWGLSGSYMGDRYELQATLGSYNYTTKESGGITDDRYITDPAEVQGGDSRVDNKSIPTQLSAAHNNLSGFRAMMNHRFKVGHYRYERDSVKTDSIISRTYIPVTSFIWTMEARTAQHRFLNENIIDDHAFFPVSYLSATGTDEKTRYWSVRNTVGVSLLEGFHRLAKAGIAVFATHEIRRYTQVTDTLTGRVSELPEGLTAVPEGIEARHTDNLLWIGGQLSKQRGSLLRYDVKARFGILGDAAGEIDVTGTVNTRFALRRDSVRVTLDGYFRNTTAPWLMQQFVSNHYAWVNKFDKTRRLRLGGTLDFPLTWTRVGVHYETINNLIYFGSDSLPHQQGGAVHVLGIDIRQDLHWRALGFENTIAVQTSSNESVLPLPKFAIRSNLYAKFRVAKVLHVQLGVDVNYYSAYYAPQYNPATMTFFNQNKVKCGNFALMNVYANFRLKQARFFVSYQHFNQKLLGSKNYFSLPHYPLNPSRFQVGVSVAFVN